jgi:hypothetical protein
MKATDSIVTVMSTPKCKRVLGPINPNPTITLTSETLLDSIIDPSSPFNPNKSKLLDSPEKGTESTARKSEIVKAHFPTKPKSKSKSRSKVKVDYRPVPRRIQLEAAIDDGELEIIGKTGNEGIPIPFTLKSEPELGISLDPVVFEVAKSARPVITSPPTSDLNSNSAEAIPAVKLEVEKPTSKQPTVLHKATGPKFYLRGARDVAKIRELELRKAQNAGMDQELERRRARDPTVTPGDYGITIENVEQFLDPVVTNRLWAVRNRLEKGIQQGIQHCRERRLWWDRKNVLLPMNSLYPLDYTLDPTRVWVEYMKCGSEEECEEGNKGVVAMLTPEIESAELVTMIGTKNGASEDRNHVANPLERLDSLDNTLHPNRARVRHAGHEPKEECGEEGGGVATTLTPECESIALVTAVDAKVKVSEGSPEDKDEEKVKPKVKVVRFAECECYLARTRADV